MYVQLPCEFEEIYFFSTEMNWPASGLIVVNETLRAKIKFKL